MTGPNCYECLYRAGQPGSTHSVCRHPVAVAAPLQALGLLTLTGRVDAKPVKPGLPDGFHLSAHDYGISKGWCSWPIDFDPIWLRECSGFVKDIPSRTETEGGPE